MSKHPVAALATPGTMAESAFGETSAGWENRTTWDIILGMPGQTQPTILVKKQNQRYKHGQ